LIISGLIIFVVGGLWYLVAAFRVSIWWGLACIFIPIVQLFFLFAHWQEAKRPFFLQMIGFGLILAGSMADPRFFHR
jgi:hypothetical protein